MKRIELMGTAAAVIAAQFLARYAEEPSVPLGNTSGHL